jgi:outer membrane lipoprotein carrier protein
MTLMRYMHMNYKFQSQSMKILNYILVLLLANQIAMAQSSSAKTQEKSDPKAKVILDRMKKTMTTKKSTEIDFNLIIEQGESKKPENQKGKIVQAGKKFAATTNDQDIYCDGKFVWIHLKDAKEVQVNNYDAGMSSEFMSPEQLIKMYETGEYLYAITGEETIGQKVLTNIEFKPKNRNSQYSKIRMGIEKGDKPNYIKVFSKNGSKFTLVINNIVYDRNYPNDYFVFNIKKHPGVLVEDLRID